MLTPGGKRRLPPGVSGPLPPGGAYSIGTADVPKNGYIFMSSRGRFAARASPSGNLIGYADRRILNSALPM